MEAAGTHPPRSAWWREGGLRRVSLGGLTGFAGGALYATARALPPAYALRGGLVCGVFTAPFFAFREVLTARLHMDGPMASTIAGGIAGYVGSLFIAGPHWKTVSHSAMAVGIGCGFADIVVSRLDWQRKVYIVNRHDAAVKAAAEQVESKESGASVQRSNSFFKLPSWLPGLNDIDNEYQDLLRRQEATVVALEKEQARIAVLLEALDRVKSATEIINPEKARPDLPASVNPQAPLSKAKDCP
ncbi:unnamed protein product [Chondrus crispus]|uniref:Uncharacterized protein n=1 Tax=Chondrus crispus TaxID=2769 RepID=R7QR26_CHOCR|nr:unnamed protein product [Chondrus crispus]CDF40213.1 unnamed protein product [Chondrus crispus]|eukprot:XP_005710507.1 unnamed protein product [Chondrus crispus]